MSYSGVGEDEAGKEGEAGNALALSMQPDADRLNFHFHWVSSPRREVVDGWDDRTKWVDTIRNYRTTETKFEIAARSKRQHPATVTTHFGTNARQQRVKLKDGER